MDFALTGVVLIYSVVEKKGERDSVLKGVRDLPGPIISAMAFQFIVVVLVSMIAPRSWRRIG
jgi:hypothetical protein